jgi:membrane protein implicated in regulation of membrane protease activity
MSAGKIALIVVLALFGIPVIMAIWSFAGSLVSAPDDMSVLVGWAIYVALVATAVLLLVRIARFAFKVLSQLTSEDGD